MSRRVLVIGGSDQGRQAIDVLDAGGDHEVVGVLDDHLAVGTELGGAPVLGCADDRLDSQWQECRKLRRCRLDRHPH